MISNNQKSQAGLLIGLGLLMLAGIIGQNAYAMDVPQIYAKVGPRVFPTLIAIGFAIAGTITLFYARAGAFPAAQGETDWSAIALISAGLIIHLNLLKPAGFIPASTILFLSVTYAFGSRKLLRDFFIALMLSTIAYVCFTRLLGLQLPPGLLKGII